MLYLVPSELPGNKGGDIFRKSENASAGISIELLPESWFSPTEEYQGWYVYCEGKEATNIQLFTIGGTEATIRELVSNINQIPQSRALDYLLDEAFQRYEARVPPYIPRSSTLDTYSGTIKTKYKEWFTDEILNTTAGRTSLHGQLRIDFGASYSQVLEEIESEFSENRDFSPQLNLPSMEDGWYWGFYLRIEDNFIPDWNIGYDHAAVFVSWQEDSGEVDENGLPILVQKLSSPLTVTIRTNTKGLYDLHSAELASLYDNYPEFFIHYEELGQEDN